MQANIQVQEIQRTPQRYSSRRATPRHIIVRFNRVEMREKMLRAAREKGRVTHKGKPIILTADLSAETLQARREWGPTFNILKEKNFQPRISYPAKLSFISEGKINFFANKQVLRDYITTRPALQELLKEALHIDGKNQYQPFQKHTKRELNNEYKWTMDIKCGIIVIGDKERWEEIATATLTFSNHHPDQSDAINVEVKGEMFPCPPCRVCDGDMAHFFSALLLKPLRGAWKRAGCRAPTQSQHLV
ncbi:LINE-1 retrotransposable element ORF1 protein [Plecturocebus cupreus]